MNSNDLGKSFNRLKDRTFLRYRGILIERKHGGFQWKEEWFSSQGSCFVAIDKYLKEAGTSLLESINRVKEDKGVKYWIKKCLNKKIK
jgi:hypothetical protein